MTNSHLFLVAAAIWGVPGVMVLTKGLWAYSNHINDDLLWLILLSTAIVGAMFFIIFSKIVKIYSSHINSQRQRLTIWHTFPSRGWGLILSMMMLGIIFRLIPSIPSQFIAAFYTGLGSMLILSAIRFLLRAIKSCV